MKKIILSGITCLALLASCSDDDDDNATPAPVVPNTQIPQTPTNANLSMNLSGLEDLGSNFAYEGWIIVNGSPVSTGTFTVDASGNPSKTTFSVNQAQLNAATMYVLSIEPVPDSDPAPAATKILAGPFSGNTATVSTDPVSSAGFNNIKGEYILATPTDGGSNTDEYSGIWFLNNSGMSPVAGLELPVLGAGWKYEGWAVINGVPVSTGTFTSVTGADEMSPFSNGGPAFPGEDFLMNAPAGLSFPTDIRGGNAVISIEPDPDNDPAPFTLKPLAGMIDANLVPHTVASMNDNVNNSFPSGSVSR